MSRGIPRTPSFQRHAAHMMTQGHDEDEDEQRYDDRTTSSPPGTNHVVKHDGYEYIIDTGCYPTYVKSLSHGRTTPATACTPPRRSKIARKSPQRSVLHRTTHRVHSYPRPYIPEPSLACQLVIRRSIHHREQLHTRIVL